MTCHKYDIFTTRNEGNLDEGIVTCLLVEVSVTGLVCHTIRGNTVCVM